MWGDFQLLPFRFRAAEPKPRVCSSNTGIELAILNPKAQSKPFALYTILQGLTAWSETSPSTEAHPCQAPKAIVSQAENIAQPPRSSLIQPKNKAPLCQQPPKYFHPTQNNR